ncbi:MAG: nickel-responsive regulator [Planctomycetes bacterium SM23_32]|nr:MAG: nickel-responsive regulator [Planctomycetes bacterium SM23_32]
MSDTVRFGVSLGLDLLDQFDTLINKMGYDNRSEAVRDLIRQKLTEEQWQAPDRQTFAAVMLVYNHHKMSLPSRLTELQHDSLAKIIGSFHVHIDRHSCLEIIVMRGKGKDLRALGERMISLKGVKYGKLNLGTSTEDIH